MCVKVVPEESDFGENSVVGYLRSRKDSLESESSGTIIPHELIRTRQLESVHLKFNQESGALIPLCLRGV
uniref:Uncharacterized protein n=1 Tax=Sphaerodactylus townsendi TaxID=933632 RepID=A0ACB8F996_9SAUR